MKRFALARSVATLTALSLSAVAQVEVQGYYGTAAGDGFGFEVCAVGDVDADGFGDLAVGAPYSDAGSLDGGRVVVISGRTRQVIRTWTGTVVRGRLGAALAACGDLDGDGHADVLASAPNQFGGAGGSVTLFSGATGAVLHQWTGVAGFGSALAADGDVTGDGGHDILVGNWIQGDLWLFDGASGALVRSHLSTGYVLGERVAFLGDVTGDGRSEYVATNTNTWGVVQAYRGSTGAPHWLASGNFGDQLGVALARTTDLTGDGLPDLLVGAGDNGSFGSDGRGYFRLLDGVNGATIDTVDGSTFDVQLGAALAVAGDLDGDGSADFLVAHGLSTPNGPVEVRSGADRSLLASLPPNVTGIGWGASLAFGDVSGDGLPDIVLGAPRSDENGVDAGSVHVFSFVRRPTTYCASEANSLGCTPAIAASGTASATLAAPFDVGTTQLLNHKAGLLFYGFNPRQTPFQGGHMCVVAPTQRTAAQSSGGTALPASDCSGSFHFDFNARIQSGADPLLVAGTQVYSQFWSRDPADPSTTNLSNALAFFIAP
ncbi:MAG: FG-GAP-like repeat-containing protein [Planctomycetota bacterium]|nr:FG-GAP-like repeat-containing protein [Planctomycetota bacterium]